MGGLSGKYLSIWIYIYEANLINSSCNCYGQFLIAGDEGLDNDADQRIVPEPRKETDKAKDQEIEFDIETDKETNREIEDVEVDNIFSPALYVSPSLSKRGLISPISSDDRRFFRRIRLLCTRDSREYTPVRILIYSTVLLAYAISLTFDSLPPLPGTNPSLRPILPNF